MSKVKSSYLCILCFIVTTLQVHNINMNTTDSIHEPTVSFKIDLLDKQRTYGNNSLSDSVSSKHYGAIICVPRRAKCQISHAQFYRGAIKYWCTRINKLFALFVGIIRIPLDLKLFVFFSNKQKLYNVYLSFVMFNRRGTTRSLTRFKVSEIRSMLRINVLINCCALQKLCNIVCILFLFSFSSSSLTFPHSVLHMFEQILINS